MQSNATAGLLRSMRRWDLVGVVINGVIGAGIFALPSRAFELAGPYSVFAFLLCAFCISLIVLCFAEVAGRFEGTGGPYLYASAAFGPTTGFMVGWLVFVARITSFSANCSLVPAYFGLFFPGLETGWPRAALLTMIVVTLAAVNVAGVRVAANASNALAIGKLLPLSVFVVVGLFFLVPARFTGAPLPEYRPFAQAVLVLVYAFTGFEMSVIPAGEARKPGRDLPIALLIGITVVVVFYVSIQVVAIGTLPDLAGRQRPLADAALTFMGNPGALMITLGIVVSLAGNLNILMLSASRILFAAAEHGQLPSPLAAVHPRFRTPAVAVLTTAAIMLTLTLSGKFMWLLTISTVSRLFTYIATAGALPILRRREAAEMGSFRQTPPPTPVPSADPQTVDCQLGSIRQTGGGPAAAQRLPGPWPPAPGPRPEMGSFRLPGGPAISAAAVLLGVWLLSNATAREARDTAIAAGVGLAIFGLHRALSRQH